MRKPSTAATPAVIIPSAPAAVSAAPALPAAVQHFDSLPASARIDARDLSLILRRSRASIYRDAARDPAFPRPQLTPGGMRRFVVGDVRAYLAAQAAR